MESPIRHNTYIIAMLYGSAVLQVMRPDDLVKVSLRIRRIVTSLPAKEQLIITEVHGIQVNNYTRT